MAVVLDRDGRQTERVRSEDLTLSTAPSRRTYLVNLKFALCIVPSMSFTSSRKHFQAHALSVFQT
jgi:hypothetical protein